MAIQRLSNTDYDFVFERAVRFCIDLVIKTEEGVLLSMRNIEPHKGLWHLPGGMVYKTELLQEAAQRIAKKETRLDVSIEGLLGYMEFPHEIQDGKDRHTVSLVLLLKVVGGVMKTDFQASEIKPFKKVPGEVHPVHGNFLKTSAKHLFS